ncbi:MAG: helix-turn-helix domain-containing protein [Planctomycetes bacterium]|nr:helix-turn-helix domain-containing protein [Planctomycetota bacterium]
MAKPTDQDERARIWFHPLRMKLVDLLRRNGPMTQTELARAVCTEPASARYHLLRLMRAGFVEPAGTRPGPKGITEKLFRNVATVKEPEMEALTFSTKHGSKKDIELRKHHFDQAAEAHRVGERIALTDPDRFFGINIMEVKASPEKLRALRDALRATLTGFMSGLDKPGDDAEQVTLCINFYPQTPA